MNITWIGNKALMVSAKHFNNEYNEAEMTTFVKAVLSNATHKGRSDRANGDHEPSFIVWGQINNTTYAVVFDAKEARKGNVEVISFYDVTESTKTIKAKRFGMEAV